MKHLPLAVLLFTSLALESAGQPPRMRRPGDDAEQTRDWPKIAAPAPSEAEIPALLAAYLESLSARSLFSGTVLLARGGDPVFHRSYGMADRERGVANHEGTAYNVGSITKVFTRVALLQLRDAGKLDFDRPLRAYLPDYPSPAADQVTLRQLLDHRSGLGDFFGPEFFGARERFEKLADYLPLFVKKPLEFEPGTQQRYSNAGYIVLGLVIERVSGRSYFDYVRDEVFAPAGLRDSSFRGGGLSSSAGGSFSTTMDLLRFVRALPRLLPRRESYRELMRMPPDVPADAPPAAGWGGGAPGLNSLVSLEARWELIVLANVDPPAATEVGANVSKLLGLGRGAAAPPSGPWTPAQTAEVVGAVAARLIEGYVYEDAGRRLARVLDEKLAAGELARADGPAALADSLTRLLRAESQDGHLRVLHGPAPEGSPGGPVRVMRRPGSPGPASPGMVGRVEVLAGNVGYLEVAHFAGDPGEFDAALEKLGGVSALIIDLRNNPGGGPSAVQHLSTYLFAGRTHLVNSIDRGQAAPMERWTLDSVSGRRLADVPLLLLTGPRTASAAESFAFGLRVTGRATMVGERTAGGGHSGRMVDLPHGFRMFLPTGRTFDPRTGRGWEAEGIRPDVEAPAEQALDAALKRLAAGPARP
jgi:CubicO group peptidase (beta-lactamase class C family)